MAVLYRKYRPQTFAEVLNQKSIIQTLQNQVAGGSVAHAYLFTGSRGIGKTSVARILAKAVNCQERIKNQESGIKAEDACGVCEICKAVEAGNFMDMVEIDAASNTGVDNIRELIEHVKFSPSLGKYKVFIIDEVHMLSKGAFNALLKTLEEPPKHALFILATTEINKVPATIISRTQRFDFKAYSPEDLLPLLEKVIREEKINFSKDILELVAENADGSARDALSLLGKLLTLGSQATLADCQQLLGVTDIGVCEQLLKKITSGDIATLPDFFAQLSERGLDYAIFTRDFLEYLRKALIYKSTGGKVDFGFSGQRRETLNQLSIEITIANLIFVIRLFLKAYKDLQGSPLPQMPVLLASIEAAMKNAEAKKKTPANGQRIYETDKPAIAATQEIIKNNETVASSNQDVVEQLTEEISSFEEARTADESINVSLEEAAGFFPKVINKIKAVNSPLANLLRGAELLKVQNGRLFLGVKFQFNKQNLDNTKNATLINSTIEEVCGKKLAISVQLLKADAEAKIETADVLNQALKVFGGELIQ